MEGHGLHFLIVGALVAASFLTGGEWRQKIRGLMAVAAIAALGSGLACRMDAMPSHAAGQAYACCLPATGIQTAALVRPSFQVLWEADQPVSGFPTSANPSDPSGRSPPAPRAA